MDEDLTLLGPVEVAELEKGILHELTRNEGDACPSPELSVHITVAYRKALINLIKQATFNSEYRGDSVDLQLLETALDPAVTAVTAPSLDVSRLTSLPINTRVVQSFDGQRVATALVCAMKMDFTGVLKAFSSITFHQLSKLNKEVLEPRVNNFALGHDLLPLRLERDVLRNQELGKSLRRYSRIPLHFKVTGAVVSRWKDKHPNSPLPFEDCNVLLVQHALGQAYPQLMAYTELLANPADTLCVWVPYKDNVEVTEAVSRSYGVDSRFPTLGDMEALRRETERAADDLVTKFRTDGKRMFIGCDGPYAREYFKKRYPELFDQVAFSEQTAFGDRPEHQQDRSIRLVSFARVPLKAKREAPFIGQAVARAVNAVLNQLATGVEEKPVLVLGGGPIGMAVAKAFSRMRSMISIYDPKVSPELEGDAAENGYQVIRDLKDAADGNFLVLGCSGILSMDEQVFLESEPNSIYTSASSKRVEINIRKLSELATDESGNVRRVLAAQVNSQKTWHYWLKDGTIRTVIADGLPANFNDINSVAPENIDYTMAMQVQSAIQAVSDDELGYHRLDPAEEAWMTQMQEQHDSEQPSVSPPKEGAAS